jgi:hypothetical protein
MAAAIFPNRGPTEETFLEDNFDPELFEEENVWSNGQIDDETKGDTSGQAERRRDAIDIDDLDLEQVHINDEADDDTVMEDKTVTEDVAVEIVTEEVPDQNVAEEVPDRIVMEEVVDEQVEQMVRPTPIRVIKNTGLPDRVIPNIVATQRQTQTQMVQIVRTQTQITQRDQGRKRKNETDIEAFAKMNGAQQRNLLRYKLLQGLQMEMELEQ